MVKKIPRYESEVFDLMATGTYIFSNGQSPPLCIGLDDSSAEAGSTIPRVPAVAIRRANTSGTSILRITHPVLTIDYTIPTRPVTVNSLA